MPGGLRTLSRTINANLDDVFFLFFTNCRGGLGPPFMTPLLELTLPFVVVIRQIEELKDKRRPERPNYLGVEAAQANLATLQMESFRPETK